MFCDTCCAVTAYGKKERTTTISIKGTEINVTYMAPICVRCGEELYDPAIDTEVIKKARAIYRERMRMVGGDVIRGYMKKYHLTPEQMAAKADCAVRDIICACDGTLLNTETDGKLKAVISA